jgi:hypothetical protein
MDPLFRKDQLATNQRILDLINRYGPQLRIALSSSSPSAVVARAVQSGMDICWWNPMYDDYDLESSLTRRIHEMNHMPCVNAGGNVGSACWVFAHAVLGKRRVGLVGMDFGYYPDSSYGQTQYYNEIVDLVGEDRLEEVYIHIHNPHTRSQFFTDPAYFWFRDAFLEMVQKADCETHNCTGGGILFGPGIHWTSLDEFVEFAGRE